MLYKIDFVYFKRWIYILSLVIIISGKKNDIDEFVKKIYNLIFIIY